MLSLEDKSGCDEKKVEDDAKCTRNEQKSPGELTVTAYAILLEPRRRIGQSFLDGRGYICRKEHAEGENGTGGIAKQSVQRSAPPIIKYPDTIER